MKKLLIFLLFGISGASFARVSTAPEPPDNTSFDFRSLNVAQAVQLIYAEALKEAYVIDPEVLTDQRNVSFRYDSAKGELRLFIKSFLDSLGLEVVRRNGVDFVAKKLAREVSIEEPEIFVYRPQHRGGSYLVDLLSPLVKGQFTARRTIRATEGEKSPQAFSPPGSAAASIDRESDMLVFSGSKAEIKLLAKMLPQVDVPLGEVVIKAYMYEVGSNDSDASALGLVLSALGGKIQVGIGTNTLENLLRLKTSSIDLVASALKSDGRFKVVTSPYQRVRSGKTARFVSGSQVSILGAIMTNQNGSTQQSYDRIESGTILEISPVVREQGVDIDLFQQVSSFVNIDGNSQPTLNKRELRTSLSVRDGEVVVIAGLDDMKEDDSRSGLSFLPFALAKSRSVRKSQLVLVMEVTRIDAAVSLDSKF